MNNWTELRQHLMGDAMAASELPDIKVPPLPNVVMEVVQRSSDPSANAGELGELIARDVGITCELLKYVNSAATGLRNKISTAPRAAAILGMKKLRLFLLTSAVDKMTRDMKSPLVLAQRFAVAGMERGLFAREIVLRQKGDADLAFSAGMLQDFMLLVLTGELTDNYVRILDEVSKSGKCLADVERLQMGWDHAEAAARVMSAWGFPDDLVCCVRLHHDTAWLDASPEWGNTEARAVAWAGFLPDVLGQSPGGLEYLLSQESQMPGGDLMSIATAVNENLQSMAPNLHGHRPLVDQLAALATEPTA